MVSVCISTMISDVEHLHLLNSHLCNFFREVKVKVAQSCLTLCNPKDYTVHGILQVRILEWVAFPFSRGSSQPRDQTHLYYFFREMFVQILLPIFKKGFVCLIIEF